MGLKYLVPKGTLSEQENRYRQAIDKYVELVSCKADNVEGQKAILTETKGANEVTTPMRLCGSCVV